MSSGLKGEWKSKWSGENGVSLNDNPGPFLLNVETRTRWFSGGASGVSWIKDDMCSPAIDISS